MDAWRRSIVQVKNFENNRTYLSILVTPLCFTDELEASLIIIPFASVTQVKNFKRKLTNFSSFVAPGASPTNYIQRLWKFDYKFCLG